MAVEFPAEFDSRFPGLAHNRFVVRAALIEAAEALEDTLDQIILSTMDSGVEVQVSCLRKVVTLYGLDAVEAVMTPGHRTYLRTVEPFPRVLCWTITAEEI